MTLLSESYLHRRPLWGLGAFLCGARTHVLLDHGFEEVDALGILGEGDDGFFGRSRVACVGTLAAETAAHGNGVHLGDLHAEQLFSRAGDIPEA